jgi:alkaline phosphatase D
MKHLFALICLIALPLAAQLPQGVAAGDVTSNSVVVWARTATAGKVHFVLVPRGGWPPNAQVATVDASDTSIPAKASFTGLSPDTRYNYLVVAPNGERAIGTFVTAATSGQHGLHFGISGDWRGELAPYVGVSNAAGKNLDFWVSLGDTIYADFPSDAVPNSQARTLAEFRAKHAEVYSAHGGSNYLADIRRSTAIFATQDDHEVTDNYAGGAPASSDPRFAGTGGPLISDTTLYANGLRAFVDYNPIVDETYGSTGDPRTAGRPKLYRYRTYGQDAAIFVLDARSFRDQELAPASLTSQQDILRFLLQSFDIDPATQRPAATKRTILGAAQLADLKHDLLDAQSRGVTWKFILFPEPIQNLGIVFAEDRYEGYARERTEILDFIKSNGIKNAVSITTDLHGVIVNNITYQLAPGTKQISTDMFEAIAGPVAFDPPLGPTVVQLGTALGLISPQTLAAYNALPNAPDMDDVVNDKDDLLKKLWNDTLLTPFGYDTIGLAGSPINATLEAGDYLAVHDYGWTEVTIDPASQRLEITAWGVPYYTPADVKNNLSSVTARVPAVISKFTVTPR